MTKRPVAVQFSHVDKMYKLFPSQKHRLASVFVRQVRYREVFANRDLNFKIYKGESVAIIGRNGAGKSTMLKMITGVSFPTTGTITVNGRVSALLELTAGFDPEFTGRENVELRGQLWGMTKEEIAKLQQEVIEFADIGVYMDQPMRMYSSGMKARVGFAISASLDPEILVVDEALSVGDKAFREKCDRKIKEIMARENVTVIFVTHSSTSAASICNRGIVLEKGKLAFDGPIDDALAYYEGPPKPPACATDAPATA